MDAWLDDIFDIFDDDDGDDNNGDASGDKTDQKAEAMSENMTLLQEYNEDFDFNLMHTHLDDEEMVMPTAIKMMALTDKELDSKVINHWVFLAHKTSQ